MAPSVRRAGPVRFLRVVAEFCFTSARRASCRRRTRSREMHSRLRLAVHHSLVIRCYRFRQQRWSRGLDTRGPGHSRCTLGGRVVAAHAAIPCGAGERLDRRFQLPTRCPRSHQRCVASRKARDRECRRVNARRSVVAMCCARCSPSSAASVCSRSATHATIAWALFFVSALAFAAFGALWAWARSLQVERAMKVRSMQQQQPTPDWMLRRAASSLVAVDRVRS